MQKARVGSGHSAARSGPLFLALVAAILCAGAGSLFAANVTDAGVNDTNGLKNIFEGATSGQTVTIDSGVTEIDLNGVNVVGTADNVTLQGQTTTDYHAMIGGFISSELSNKSTAVSFIGKSAMDSRIGAIVDEMVAAAPGTRIYNSDPNGATQPHGTISAPEGGFTIKNLTVSGTNSSVDKLTGASVYMGLIGSSFSRNTTDVNGMKSIENMAFINNVSEAHNGAYSVGVTTFFTQRRYDPITGAYLNTDIDETLDLLKGNLFMGNKSITWEDDPVNPNAGLRGNGGGLTAWLNITEMDSNVFVDNYVRGGHAFGGGAHVTSVGTMTKSLFYDNMAEGWHNVQGGGLYVSDAAGFGSVSDSMFVGNTAKAIGTLAGKSASGGGLAVRRGGSGTVADTIFAYNEAISESQGGNTTGGGMSGGNKFTSLTDSLFYGNVARKTYAGDTAGGAYGGALSFAPGLAGDTSFNIVNTGFYANQAVSTSGFGGGGAIAIASTGTGETADFRVNFRADAGKETVISGNTFNGKASGVYLGALSSAGGNAQRDFIFNIVAEDGGKVAMLDPITVDLNNGKAFTLINHDHGGDFIWNGINNVSAAAGATIVLEATSNTTFMEGFHLHNAGSGNAITINLDNSANVNMVLSGRNQNMALFEDADIINDAGAKLNAIYYGFTDYTGSWLLSDAATAQGTDLTTQDIVDEATGASTKVTLTTSGGETWVNMAYTGPTKAFASASKDAQNARPQINEAFSGLAASGLSAGQQAGLFASILDNPDNYLPSASIMAHADNAFSTHSGLLGQAMMVNNRSRSVYTGEGQVAAVTSGSGLASPVYGGDYGSSYNNFGRFRVWADYIGSRIDQDKKDGLSGYDVKNNGAVFGASYDFGCVWTVGGYFAYSDGDTDFDDVYASIDSDIYQGALFAQYRSNYSGWIASADLSFAHFDNDSKRHTYLGAHEASYDQNVYGAGLELGYEFKPWCNGRLTPFLGLRYQHMRQDRIRESGAGMNLDVDAVDADSFTSTLGINLAHDIVTDSCTFTPSVSAAWKHQYADRNVSSSYKFGGYSIVNDTSSIRKSRDSFEIGAAMSAMLVQKECFSFGLNGGYNASISSNRVEHNFYAGVELGF